MAIKQEKIIVKINRKDGTAVVSVAGVSGPSCTEITKKLLDAMGSVSDVEQTDEYFQEESNSVVTK